MPPHKKRISAILYFTNTDKEIGDFGGVGVGVWLFCVCSMVCPKREMCFEFTPTQTLTKG